MASDLRSTKRNLQDLGLNPGGHPTPCPTIERLEKVFQTLEEASFCSKISFPVGVSAALMDAEINCGIT